ncbi:MAG TPA: hypothetical protein VGC10_09690 [Sphingomonas sp.]
MIATRFRTVAWVALVALAALGCYLVSLRVAAERAQVARLDRALRSGRQDIRDLTTELGTRSRLVQLERWNADVLALTAPKAGQYLAGQMQLASLATTPPAAPADAATPAAAALEPPVAVARAAYRPVRDRPATRLVHQVSLALDDSGDGGGLIRHVALLYAGGPPARP